MPIQPVAESDPRISRRLDQFVGGCSVLALGFGLWVLAGWAFHVQTMKTILPGQVAVKANAAIGFVLLGFSLWTLRRQPGTAGLGWKLAARAAAAVAGTVGLLSFLEFLWGWGLGMDQLLCTAGVEDTPGSVRPGLMSPLTAWGFVSLSAVLCCWMPEGGRAVGRHNCCPGESGSPRCSESWTLFLIRTPPTLISLP